MRVHLVQTLDGARRARGLAVVIDVFRAFTTAPHALAAGARRVMAVDTLDMARAMREADPSVVLVGERDCVPPPDFDYGNSPELIRQADLSGRTVVHTTSAGTRGLAAALAAGADEVLTGAFVNAAAIVEYVRRAAPAEVTLVALGTAGQEPSAEDDLCAMYLKNALEGFPNAFEAIVRHLGAIPAAQKFFDPEKAYAPREDFDLCLELDRFDFVLRARWAGGEAGGAMELERIDIPAPQGAGA